MLQASGVVTCNTSERSSECDTPSGDNSVHMVSTPASARAPEVPSPALPPEMPSPALPPEVWVTVLSCLDGQTLWNCSQVSFYSHSEFGRILSSAIVIF